jgi:two-component system chemotaxis response regulator CheB
LIMAACGQSSSNKQGAMVINQEPLRVLIVDDSSLYRKIVRDILADIPNVLAVGTAPTGKVALDKIKSLAPDLLILDVEMPEMTGLELLEQIKTCAYEVGAIMLSSFTRRGSNLTLQALELGAFDFIPKPSTGDINANRKTIKNSLMPMLTAYERHRKIQKTLNGCPTVKDIRGAAPSAAQRAGVQDSEIKIVGIGISTGGPQALAHMARHIPPQLGLPIAIVQHMPSLFTKELASRLNSLCSLTVKEAEDGDPVNPNTIYIAPGGRQMKITGNGRDDNKIIRITDDYPENNSKPSADYLFRSIAEQYGRNAIGVIMTGMGSDGLLGLKLMKRRGATIIAQNKASCVVYGMPRGPIEAGIVDYVVPMERIVDAICRRTYMGAAETIHT